MLPLEISHAIRPGLLGLQPHLPVRKRIADRILLVVGGLPQAGRRARFAMLPLAGSLACRLRAVCVASTCPQHKRSTVVLLRGTCHGAAVLSGESGGSDALDESSRDRRAGTRMGSLNVSAGERTRRTFKFIYTEPYHPLVTPRGSASQHLATLWLAFVARGVGESGRVAPCVSAALRALSARTKNFTFTG